MKIRLQYPDVLAPSCHWCKFAQPSLHLLAEYFSSHHFSRNTTTTCFRRERPFLVCRCCVHGQNVPVLLFHDLETIIADSLLKIVLRNSILIPLAVYILLQKEELMYSDGKARQIRCFPRICKITRAVFQRCHRVQCSWGRRYPRR